MSRSHSRRLILALWLATPVVALANPDYIACINAQHQADRDSRRIAVSRTLSPISLVSYNISNSSQIPNVSANITYGGANQQADRLSASVRMCRQYRTARESARPAATEPEGARRVGPR